MMYLLLKYLPILRRSPKPGAPFDADDFLRLRLWQLEGYTTRAENDYINAVLKRNEDAWTLSNDIEETFPNEHFPTPAAIRVRKLLATAALILLILGLGYAISRYYRIVKRNTETSYYIQAKPLHEIAGLIEKTYKVKVIFDQPDVADFHFTGKIDADIPLEDWLENLTMSSGVIFKCDSEGNVHFR